MYPSVILLISIADVLCPDFHLASDQVMYILQQCHNLVSTNYSIQDAVVWGGDFRFPPEVASCDLRELVDLRGSREQLVRKRQSTCPHTRISLDSIRLSRGEASPLSSLLQEFVVEGVDVMVGPEFYCNRTPPPFSPAYRQAHVAIDKLLYESYLAGH